MGSPRCVAVARRGSVAGGHGPPKSVIYSGGKRSVVLPATLGPSLEGPNQIIIIWMAKRKYKTKKTQRAYKRKNRGFKRMTLKKLVKSVISRTIETKSNQTTSSQQNIFQAIDNLAVFNLIPVISQGTGESDRIGSRIQPTRFTVKLSIFCNNMNGLYVGASASYFDIYIFKFKGSQNYSGPPTNTDMVKFLQNDNSTDAYNGQVLDGLRPINDDLFTLCYKKRITLSNIYFTTVGQMSGYYQSTNPHRTLYIDITKHIKKHLIYDDINTAPTNDNMYIAIGSTQTDGTSLAGQVIGSYYFITDLKYKDS